MKNVSVSNPTDSFLLDITYTAGTAKGAAAGANAFAPRTSQQRQKLAQDAASLGHARASRRRSPTLNKTVDDKPTRRSTARAGERATS